MKKIIITALFALLISSPAFGWGREGHETIAKIADNNLQPSAKKKIEKYLDGHSIVYWSKWMDDYRHTKTYRAMHHWHTAPVNQEYRYEDYLLDDDGDAVNALENAIKILENYRDHSDSTVAVNLKYVIHIVGDMHCPGHIKYQDENGKIRPNKYNVYPLKSNTPMSIHSVWDFYAIQTTRIYSSTEWAEELERPMSRKDAKIIGAGTPRDWMHDNAVRCEIQYELAGPGDRLDQDFLNAAMPLIETQILYAGYRLAALLNDLF